MTTRIVADLMIPGRGEPVEHATVVMDGSKIQYAGPTAGAPASTDPEETVELPVILPGLWDCHGHFTGMANPNLVENAITPPVVAAARSTRDLAATLQGGITSVREVGGLGLLLSRAINEGSIVGPHVYGAGRILSTSGGHADVHSLPIDWVRTMPSGAGLGVLCDGVAEVTRAVRLNLRNNARVIKICASGGVMSEIDDPIHQQFSDEEIRAIVEEAARADRVVAAHCHGKPGIMAALRAGVRTIEHGTFMDEEAAELMVEKGAILVPTRFVFSELLHQVDRLPRYAYEKGQAIAAQHEMGLKIAVAKGVRIAAGCDIFVSGQAYGQNGKEISNLIEAGMTELEAIEAATATATETLGPQAPLSGQLKAGYAADVIALDSDPFDDRSIWGEVERVTHVWKGGAIYKGGRPPR